MSLYEKLPTDFLARFYYEIRKNIKKGILTECMYSELELIEAAAAKRGTSIAEFRKHVQLVES